ncbi:DNA topoisomerase IB [Costertonia aggregata]|uniref:DNA topoisomerase n=1 Tax=Costertonia aggregata TaxID=343403 RepID=A0A7H9ANF0_9FLAO|nr:DNA topoisomerase IB [Costertonia aggregata]QLG44966.1 DNA topoisomerase IB [Costertonia aggregata]
MKTDPSLLNTLLSEPKKAISHLDLVYVSDDKMPIIRKKNGDGFQYLYGDRALRQKEDLQRIKALVIPPAWQNVKITHLPNGHLQAVGRDTKKRKQYKYHELWTKVRKQTKFYRMGLFGKSLPKIRKTVDLDLEQKKWTRTKVLALVVRLMEETHIRIGNEQYARYNQTYGISTLRKRHVHINKEKMKFEFKGKRGKEHKVTVRNKKLIRLVSQCEEIPGWELFHYYDNDGNKEQIDSGMVNAYVKEISGMDFTAKDFRTWAAGVIFFNSLMDMGTTKDKEGIKSNILAAYDTTAKALGNTRNVCRSSYVHPILPMAYEKGKLNIYFEKASRPDAVTKYLSSSEIALLDVIATYKPELKE